MRKPIDPHTSLVKALQRAFKKIGPDGTARIVTSTFRRHAFPKHLRRFL